MTKNFRADLILWMLLFFMLGLMNSKYTRLDLHKVFDEEGTATDKEYFSHHYTYYLYLVFVAQSGEGYLINYLFSMKYYRTCRDLNPGLLRYQADLIPTELSWLGYSLDVM